jgi:hypothetical protein
VPARATAAIALIAASLIARLGNRPIQAVIMGRSPGAVPPGWDGLRDSRCPGTPRGRLRPGRGRPARRSDSAPSAPRRRAGPQAGPLPDAAGIGDEVADAPDARARRSATPRPDDGARGVGHDEVMPRGHQRRIGPRRQRCGGHHDRGRIIGLRQRGVAPGRQRVDGDKVAPPGRAHHQRRAHRRPPECPPERPPIRRPKRTGPRPGRGPGPGARGARCVT